MSRLLIPASGGPETFQYGMNDYNNAKTLKRNCQQLIQNMYPNDTGIPRNGMNEKMSDTTAIGQGTEHVFYQPHSKYVSFGGKEFFFQWAKNVTTTDEFELEVWNLTDGGRTKLVYGDFNQTDVHISMKVLYNALYVTMEYEMATARENAYRTRNKIIEWSGSAWTVREFGIDLAPSLGEITVGEDEGYEFPTTIAYHTLLSFKGKIWLIGGSNGTTYSQKVFYSFEGKVWYEAGTDSLPYPVHRHGSVVYDNKMWIIGGVTTSLVVKASVYYSVDGIVWTEAGTNSLPAACGRYDISPIVMSSKMWIIGGTLTWDGDITRKVFYSTNGSTWTEAGTDALPDSVSRSCCLVFAGKMWSIAGLMAGADRKVYSSSDGSTWAEEGTLAFPIGIVFVRGCVYSSKMWIVGGYINGSAPAQTVYYSTDGITWTEAGTNSYPYAVLANGVISFDSKIFSIGGDITGGVLKKDVYTSTDGITWTQQKVNAIAQNKYVSVAGTFIRLSNSLYQRNFTVPTSESIESLGNRQTVLISSVGAYGILLIPMPSSGDIADALAQGSTHLRIWRTLGAATAAVAEGLSLRFTEDIPLSGGSYGASYVHHSQIPDAELSGETNILEMPGYDVPPMGRYFDFDIRSWIGGDPANPGYWYYSESPVNVQYPQKYAHMFKLASYWFAIDPNDGQKDTGTVLLKGDRYFFKERKIFALAGSDVNNVPTLISDPIGCAFPQSITRLYVPQLGGECIGFLSEYGPAVLLPGGTVQLMTEFTIAALYPRENGIIKKSTGVPTSWYTRNKVTAAFWDSTWWVIFGDSRDTGCELTTNKIYGMHFERDADAIGPFELTIPQYTPVSTPYTILEPLSLIPVDNNRCYAFSHKTNASAAVKYRLVQFCDPTKYQDTLVTEGALPYSMVYESAYRFAQARQLLMGVARKLLTYIKFADTAGLTLTVTSDDGRLVATRTYVQTRTSGAAANVAVRDVLQLFFREDLFGHKFKVKVSKVVPSTGAVEMFGHELELDPFDREPEFSDGSDDLTGDTTYIVEAGTTPEVDAYAA